MPTIAYGYDWAWAQIGGAQVKSNGGSFCIRYIGGSARITDIERRNLHRDGINILPIWETAADATEGGFNRGVSDARAANAELDALGWPSDGLVLYADDQNDPDPTQEVAYTHGVKDTPGRPSDLYSGGNVLVALDQAGMRTFGGWMVETWYPHDGADPFMIQLANTREPSMVGVNPTFYDTNLLYRPVPMWGPQGTTSVINAAHEAVTTQEDDEMVFITNSNNKTFCYWRSGGSLFVRGFTDGKPDGTAALVSDACDPTNLVVRAVGFGVLYTPAAQSGKLVMVTPTGVGPKAEIV